MAKTIFSIKANKLKKKYGMAETEYLVYADLRAVGGASKTHGTWRFRTKVSRGLRMN